VSDAPPPPPPPPPSAPPPPPPSSAPAGGPIGKPRSIGLVILLSIVTLGIWTVVWSYQNGEELRRYRSEGLGGIAYLFITFLISPVTMFLMASEVDQRSLAVARGDREAGALTAASGTRHPAWTSAR
jgi:hypothetical protein